MKKIIQLMLITCLGNSAIYAQATAADSSFIVTINQQIDDYVVQHNTEALAKLYADDFVFSHGSGRVEGKKGWFTSVAKGNFLARQHDSVTVEIHPGVAVVRGKLSVQKKTAANPSRYHLKYIRVYAYRNKAWQMISHVTYWEYHEAG
ncbi:MAG: nuclear transport factor 2 family protein [Ferruginibacter sp.]